MKYLIRLTLMIVFICGALLVFDSKAGAATVFDGETHTPSSSRALCPGGVPVDFSPVITNVNLNPNNGLVTFDIVIGWRSCGDPNATRAYAIYASPDICPLSGWYGGGPGGEATDCVKYIGSPAYTGPGNGLTCPGGRTNAQCVTGDFNAVQVSQQAPTNAGSLEVISMSQIIPGWALRRTVDGSFGYSSQMCQFYKPGPNYVAQITNSRCINVSVNVSWKVVLDPDAGYCTASVSGGSIVNPGDTKAVNFAAYNTGGRNWDLNGLNATRHRLRLLSYPATPWPGAPNQTDITGTGDVENNPIFGQILRPGGGMAWQQNFNVPSSLGSGDYTFVWKVYGRNTDTGVMEFINGFECSFTMTVKPDRPYFRVYGGDVIAGRPLESGGSCSANKNAGAFIRAFALGSGDDWQGAGSQFAASSSAVISDFISGSMQANSGSNIEPPINLSFGNDSGNAGFDKNAHAGCITNLVERREELGVPDSTAGDLQQIPGGGGIRFYDHSVNVINSVTPSSVGFSDIGNAEMPIYLVDGDINIPPGVTELWGLFFATGTINTCSSDASLSGCDNKLTVTGALVAKKVEFNRLQGDVNSAALNEPTGSGNIAEVINFDPMLYLALANYIDSKVFKSNNQYDSIVGLPPVL